MNMSIVQMVQQPSKTILITKEGKTELQLTAHGVLELGRSVIQSGGRVNDRCSMWMLPDGKMVSQRTTTIVEKAVKE